MSTPSQTESETASTSPKQSAPQKTAVKQRTVHPCNFRTAGRLSNEHARLLSALHETFALRLASTLACENQMFRFGPRAFALQFHVEVTAADVERWVGEDAAFVLAANGPGGGPRILADTGRYMPRYTQIGDRLIRDMLQAMLR